MKRLVLPAALATVLAVGYGATLTSGYPQVVRQAGAEVQVQVAGRAGVPDNATAVAVNITAADAQGVGYITAYACGDARPTASNLNFSPGAPVANGAIVEVGAGGNICLYVGEAATELIVDVNGWFTDASGYTGESPRRLLDSRPGASTSDGLFLGMNPLGHGSLTTLDVAGRAGVPGDADSVALNITAADASGVGYVTAYPCEDARPNASTLNFFPGRPVANNAIIDLGPSGDVCLYVSDASAQLIVDVNGWFADGSALDSRSPRRLLDTRPGTSTADGSDAGGGRRQADTELALSVAGRLDVPDDATSVALNITAADASGIGYVTAYPCGEQRPTASHLNYGPGAPVANGAIVRLGNGGDVCLFTGDASTHLVVDVNGWFADGAGFTSVTPERLMDTRLEQPSIQPGGGSFIPSGAAFAATFDGNTGLDAFDTEIHHRNLRLGDTSGHGFDATWPGDHDMNCSPPDQSRTVHAANPSESFYFCRDHMMTSLGDIDAYSILSFSPKQVFSTVSRVCWDQNVTWSTLRGRQWTELVVRPAAELPGDGRMSHTNATFRSVDDTALAHGPTTVGVMLQGPAGAGAFYGGVERWYDDFYFQDTEGLNSKAIRRQHCVTDNKDGTLTLSIDQGAAGTYSRSFAGSFPRNARVIFEDHKYTPNKRDDASAPPTTSYTWHWDNIFVEP